MGQNLQTMSISQLSENVQRKGLGSHCLKLKEAEDQINSAVDKVLKTVLKPGEVLTVYVDTDGKIRLNPTFTRKFVASNESSSSVIEDATAELLRDFVDCEEILDTPPRFEDNDLCVITPFKDGQVTKYKIDKIGKHITGASTCKAQFGDKEYEVSDLRLSETVISESGETTVDKYRETYFFVSQQTSHTLITSLAEEAKATKEYDKYTTWVIKGKKPSDDQAINKVKELHMVIQAMMDSLTGAEPSPTQLSYVDGLFLYCRQSGMIKDMTYEEFIKDRIIGVTMLLKALDPDTSSPKCFLTTLPLLHKYVSTDIDGFLKFLYSFWNSNSKQTIAGRVAAILSSKPNSGSLEKSQKTGGGKPIGKEGNPKSKRSSKKAKEEGKQPQSKPKGKGNGKSQRSPAKHGDRKQN